MPAEEFVRRMRLLAGQHDTHYAFWIGAGCSISSNIPGAASLVTDRWLPQLRRVRGVPDADLDEFAKGAFPSYDPEDPGAMYGAVMEELFIQPEARQREVEALCDGRFPGFGYAVLAALLGREDGLFNVALTTNFDDLIADAMYVFTEARPLVIPDESLAGFIRPTRMRPLVIKVHGDHRLSPRNTRTETETLKDGISEGIGALLHDRGVIFVGYGGNDADIGKLLKRLPAQALPLGVWWASREEPEGVLRDWLEERDAIWVETPGFDEFMLLFQSEFDIPHPSSSKFDKVFSSYLETFRKLENRVGRIPDSDPQASSLKDAAARVDAVATDWSAVLLQAARIEDEEPDKAEELYRDGIKEFPKAPLLNVAYGQLLMMRARFAEALAQSERAMKLNPDNPQVLWTHGYALAADGRIAESLEMFSRAVDLAPRSISALTQYGIFLAMDGATAEARQQLSQVLELQPAGPVELALVAVFLDDLGDHAMASAFHERSLDEDSENANNHANYARCLIALGRSEDAMAETDLALAFGTDAMAGMLIEVLFYRFVVGSEADRLEALARLKPLISSGIRSPVWDLDMVVEFGQSIEHPDAKWLGPLAAVIEGDAEPESLDDWKKWRDA